jgi:hypothetical protein
LIPLALFAIRALVLLVFQKTTNDVAQAQVEYAVLFRTLILRFVVYFGCVAVFVPLFRATSSTARCITTFSRR